MPNAKYLNDLRDLIAGDLPRALQHFRQLLDDSPQLDEIILQQARFQAIRKQIRLGTVSHEEATLTNNQIRAGLLDLLREIEEQGERPEIKTELERAIVNSKNVVIDSPISANTVIIGDGNVIHQAGERKIPQQLTPYTPIDAEKECIGRDADLKTLADTLSRSSKVVVVNGLGGIGKTTVAKAWFQTVKDRHDHFAWIDLAGNDDRSNRQYAYTFVEAVAYHPTLSANLHLTFGEKEPPEQRFQVIMNALRQLKGNNLLVIDNAGPDLEQPDIRGQLPLPPHWQVLVTSRRRLSGYEPMPLDRLAPQYAAELFRQHYQGPCPDDELEALLREVDYHTLTIELLAKTLQEHFGSLSIGELTTRLQRRQLADAELQRRIALNHSPEETEVYLHLLTTFDCAGLDEAERLLLARFSALPSGGAHSAAQLEEWLKIEAAERRSLHETLSRLDRKGWLTRNPDNSFSLHRMVQQAVLYQLQPGMAELGVLVETFTQKMEFDTSTNYTLLFPWIPFAEQILAVLKEPDRAHKGLLDLMNNLGVVYYDLGKFELASNLLDLTLQFAVNILGPEHDDVATVKYHLGEMYRAGGQYDRARDMLESALESDLKHFDHQHPYAAKSRSVLAGLYIDLGQYDLARDMLESALESDLKNFGPENLEVTYTQTFLGIVYTFLGRFAEACNLLESALELTESSLGPHHPNVAVLLSNLASVYFQLGQHDQARDMLESALESDLKNFGPEHPNVAVSQLKLADVYRNLGQYERARNLMESALESGLKNFGPEHPSVAISWNNLAHVYAGLGNTVKALGLFEQALAIFRKQLGEDHPYVATVKQSIENLRDKE